jgi:hypothetical protein
MIIEGLGEPSACAASLAAGSRFKRIGYFLKYNRLWLSLAGSLAAEAKMMMRFPGKFRLPASVPFDSMA